jgi:hypothetical protein
LYQFGSLLFRRTLFSRVRCPIRPHVGADNPAFRADHSRAQSPDGQAIWETVTIYLGAVVTQAIAAIDQQMRDAVAPHLPERDRWSRAVAFICHGSGIESPFCALVTPLWLVAMGTVGL